jgi:KipI family sensor histidine kinase inhibitor
VTLGRAGDTSVYPFGDRAVFVDELGVERREALMRELTGLLPDLGVRLGMAGLLVESVKPATNLRDRVEAAMAQAALTPAPSASAVRVISIPVVYDGADLTQAAGQLDCSPEDLVRAHQVQVWGVAMMGFAPGFAYLVPVGTQTLPWGALPRRASPRSTVPAGSVAVAAGMSAVYPSQMPGGWHLLGRTSVRVFDASADMAALLAPGDHVRFVGTGP